MAQPVVNSVMDTMVKLTPGFLKNWYMGKLTTRLAKFGAKC